MCPPSSAPEIEAVLKSLLPCRADALVRAQAPRVMTFPCETFPTSSTASTAWHVSCNHQHEVQHELPTTCL